MAASHLITGQTETIVFNIHSVTFHHSSEVAASHLITGQTETIVLNVLSVTFLHQHGHSNGYYVFCIMPFSFGCCHNVFWRHATNICGVLCAVLCVSLT